MDDAARADLRVRFIKLIVVLNAILILIAVAVLVYYKVPPGAGTVVVAVLLAAAIGLFFYFLRMYRATKEWLEDLHRKRGEEASGAGGTAAGITGEKAG